MAWQARNGGIDPKENLDRLGEKEYRRCDELN